MSDQCSFSGEELTPDIACRFFEALKGAISHAARAGIAQFIKSHDIDEPFLVRNGVRFGRKVTSLKEYLTPFGIIHLDRNRYQASHGGKTFQPLDEKWEMLGEFATREVRECVMFHTAFMSPGGIETCMQ